MSAESCLACITRIRLRSAIYFPAFAWHTLRSLWQARRAPGNLQARGRTTGSWTFWTLTIWRDERAMLDYMRTGAHARAMRYTARWFDEASVARFAVPAPTTSWEDAVRQLAAVGRPVRVAHPSPAQQARSPLGSSA